MIQKGAFTLFETDFALPSATYVAYDFDIYLVNITIMSMACASLYAPVTGAVSTDMGRQCSAGNNGNVFVGTGFPLVVAQEWYNPPVMSTEYYARQTCGHTKTASQISGSYARLTSAGFASSSSKTPYIVTTGGVVCEDALPGLFGPAGIPIKSVAGTVPDNLGKYTVTFVSCDNQGGPQSGGTLAISGTTATFTYDSAVPIRPVLTAALNSSAAGYAAAVITDVSLTAAQITFKDETGAVVTFPGGRLGITGFMFTE